MAQASTGGYTPTSLVSAGSNNAQVIKSSSGSIGSGVAFNVNSAARYLKFYDKATTPAPASDTPVFVVAMPGNTSGAGAVVSFENLVFANGIGIAIVAGIASNDNTSVSSGDCVISIGYR